MPGKVCTGRVATLLQSPEVKLRCYSALYFELLDVAYPHGTHIKGQSSAEKNGSIIRSEFARYLHTFFGGIYDEYRKKEKTSQRPITEEEKKFFVFDHQINQKLATDVIGVSFDAQ